MKPKLLWTGPTAITGRWTVRYYPYSLWVERKWWFVHEFTVYDRGNLIAKGYAITRKIAMCMAEKQRDVHMDLKTR